MNQYSNTIEGTFMNIPVRHTRSGFSLMEIMIVITIIGLFVAVGTPALFRYLERAKKTNAKQEMNVFKQGIDQYNIDTHTYPQTLKDLIKSPTDDKVSKRWGGPYYSKKAIPKDPWGKAYVYQLNPENAEHPYELFSYGGTKKSEKNRISVWDEE